MKVTIWYNEYFLPTRRHRKERCRNLSKDVEINIRKPEDFPVAMVVKDYETRYENGKDPFGLYETEYRVFDGELYKPVRASEFICRAEGWAREEHLNIGNRKPYCESDCDFTEESVVLGNTFERELKFAEERAKRYLKYDDKIWRVTGEPMYVINTFGLGFNHGGTAIFIQDFYNGNISNKNYFNALRKREAIEYGVETALARGDDKSVPEIRGTDKDIKVLMPELIKRNPMKDYGEGNRFLNELEDIVVSSSSAGEAGLLAMAKTFAEIL